MAGTDSSAQIGLSDQFLEGVDVDTTAGNGLFREGVCVSDPVLGEARARVANTSPAGTEYAMLVRQVGPVDTGLTQPTTPADTQPVVDSNVTGSWGYLAGTSGTANVPVGAKVLQISATATLGGSFSVDGGASITIPPDQQFTLEPRGNLVAPVVVFSNTASYVIEYVI